MRAIVDKSLFSTCSIWPKAPPGHRSPASDYSPFDVGRDAYKVSNSNIQGPSHRQQT